MKPLPKVIALGLACLLIGAAAAYQCVIRTGMLETNGK